MPNERISVETHTRSVFGETTPVTAVTFSTSLYDTTYSGVRASLLLRPEAKLSHGALEQLAMEIQPLLRNLLMPSLKSGQPVNPEAYRDFQKRAARLAGVCHVPGMDGPQNVLLMCQNLGYSH